MKESSERVIHLKQWVKRITPLKIVLYFSVGAFIVSFFMIEIFVDSVFVLLIYVVIFSVSILILLLLFELFIFFSLSVFEGEPKKCTTNIILREFFLLFGFLLFLSKNALNLKDSVMVGILVIVLFLLLIIILSIKPRPIKHNVAGMIFTYTSISTALYLSYIALFFPKETLQKMVEQVSQQQIELEIVLIIIVFFLLVIMFFVFKEYIFQYYSQKLISQKTKELKNEKKTLINTIYKELDAVEDAKEAEIDRICKKVDILEKKMTYTDKKIEKVEKEYEFKKMLKTNIVISPLWVLILEILKETPLIADIAESFIEPILG